MAGDGIGGLVGGAVASVAGAIGGALSTLGGLFFKAGATGARAGADRRALAAHLGPGQPLDGSTRTRMESAFGESFSQVRVHDDAPTAGLARDLGAQAFTLGEHVAFGQGSFRPGTPAGDALLAHELAHVVQQSGGVLSGATSATPDDAIRARRQSRCLRRDRSPVRANAGPTRAPASLARRPPPVSLRARGSPAGCGTGRRDAATHQPDVPRHHHGAPDERLPRSVDLRGALLRARIERHVSAGRQRRRYHTKFDLPPWNLPYTTKNGIVDGFTGPFPKGTTPTLTVQTLYGPGESRSTPSGYGRGTTLQDIAAKNTSLGFHEGQHGGKIIEFVSTSRSLRSRAESA